MPRMVNRIHANERLIVNSLIVGIMSHDLIRNSPIYHPVIKKGKPERLTIKKCRAYGGIELLEPGLTLAVYPYHSPYDNLKGSVPDNSQAKSIDFTPYDIGATESLGPLGVNLHANIKIVVQLYYVDSEFDRPVPVNYDHRIFNYVHTPQGQRVAVSEEEWQAYNRYLGEEVTERESVTVHISPGEEILRSFMPLLRAVIRDIGVMRPLTARRPTIKSVDYPTTSWIRRDTDLVFHTAYMILEFCSYEAALARDVSHLLPVHISTDMYVASRNEDFTPSEDAQFEAWLDTYRRDIKGDV